MRKSTAERLADSVSNELALYFEKVMGPWAGRSYVHDDISIKVEPEFMMDEGLPDDLVDFWTVIIRDPAKDVEFVLYSGKKLQDRLRDIYDKLENTKPPT